MLIPKRLLNAKKAESTLYTATFLTLGGLSPQVLASDITVSPPNWWVGMKSPSVELMLYGNDIADDKVSVKSEHVRIEKVTALDSENYLFVTLNTTNVQAGDVTLVLKDDDGSEREVRYNFKERRLNASSRQGFGPSDSIYLIAPDRFSNGDISNDNIAGYADKVDRTNAGGRHGGDIKGIVDNLDYIKEMGFTQVWTMPLLENAMDKYSYHGYSTTDYYKIDPRFGTNEDYVALSKAAHEKGIGIIMDMVLNHIGSNHLWMKDTPSLDWINNEGKFIGTTHKRETLHDPHLIESDQRAFSDGWFVPTMPDLNQRNPQLANYLIQNAIWWVEYANLSGIRVDTYSYPDKAFLSAWTTRLMKEYPNFNIVGEEWSVNPAITAYWQAGSHRHDDYVSALPSVMDFPLQQVVVKALGSDESWNSGFISIYETLATDFLYGDANNLVVFPDNHDMSRIYTELGQDLNKWNMAMTFFLTTRGIPQVFYGTEILMDNTGTNDHGVIRTDFPGGWAVDDADDEAMDKARDKTKNGFTGNGLSDQELWAQSRIKQLLSLRKTHPEFFEGSLKHFAPKEGVYTYFRLPERPSDSMLMVILNKKETTLSLDSYSAMLSGFDQLKRLSDGKIWSVDDTLSLPAMSANVFIVQ